MIRRYAVYSFIGGLIIVIMAGCMGCGKSSNTTAPSETIITINPASTSISISGDTKVDYFVKVIDADGNPMNRVEIRVSGNFAAPRSPARYQFCKETNMDPVCSNPVDSGFSAKTDENGVYNFTILIPVTVGGSPNAFDDTITVTSGTAYGTATITLE